MKLLQDSIHLEAPPDRVWAWLTGLSEHYVQWHPDHVMAEWERGAPNRVGSVLRVVEILAGRREELRFEVTHYETPRRIQFRVKGAHSLLIPGGSFQVSAEDEGSRFTACLWYRFGRLTEKLFSRRVEALRRHMHQEGLNLKHLIEMPTQ